MNNKQEEGTEDNQGENQNGESSNKDLQSSATTTQKPSLLRPGSSNGHKSASALDKNHNNGISGNIIHITVNNFITNNNITTADHPAERREVNNGINVISN